jgi:hypothetical protein
MHGNITGAYRMRNLRVRNRVVLTNKTPSRLVTRLWRTIFPSHTRCRIGGNRQVVLEVAISAKIASYDQPRHPE